MGSKSKSKGTPDEKCLILPRHKDLSETLEPEIIDTHTHVWSTYETYLSKYAEGQHRSSVSDFVKALLLIENGDSSNKVAKVVDVWCEAPLKEEWKQVVKELEQVGPEGFYNFVVGAHPLAADSYSDQLEATYLEAHAHPRCVGWGECGLDTTEPGKSLEVQKQVLRRQLKAAIGSGLNKAITIHTRQADDAIWKVLTEVLPRETRIHVHCFTDSPDLATKLLDHFPNLYIGITGVVSYSSNLNTAQVIRNMFKSTNCSPTNPSGLRILLETDAPYMVPSNMGPPTSLGMKGGQKLPFSHSAMIPYVAQFVAQILNEERKGEDETEIEWSTEDVLRVARENARKVYRI